MLVALSALLLSVCGLFISIYEASLIRRSQRASVWPYVEVTAGIHNRQIDLRVHYFFPWRPLATSRGNAIGGPLLSVAVAHFSRLRFGQLRQRQARDLSPQEDASRH